MSIKGEGASDAGGSAQTNGDGERSKEGLKRSDLVVGEIQVEISCDLGDGESLDSRLEVKRVEDSVSAKVLERSKEGLKRGEGGAEGLVEVVIVIMLELSQLPSSDESKSASESFSSR